ncbi:M15 family metallopeptidase [Shewanella profunda]|uniref:M15 family metallopeptidase n=1 Tax=Shewanella profunda TaxID=254793 RepID=UPI000DFF119C|nr:M15 family metallopeptidase [Shewanella profunda]MCL1089729.1 M15 family metallopeptidase [Shewanella profunda]SUI53381.1 D-alanyl-D-alanine carboxypeptidase [Shewanella putrefaciens]
MLNTSTISPATARLYGLEPNTLVEIFSPYHSQETRFQLEANTALAFEAMAAKAAQDGIHLAICSAYRPFERQLAIWNAKASGKRVVLDAFEQQIDIKGLTDNQLVDLILLWSALPGASRHHWGTDIDVFDASQIDAKALRLIEVEYIEGGPCAKLHSWLKDNAHDFGFYFPFQRGQSAVSPEPWHISYFPVSQLLLPQFDTHELAILLKNSDMLLKDAVLSRLSTLVDEYVLRIAKP